MIRFKPLSVTKILVLIVGAFFVTALSVSIARLGTSFKCDDPQQIQPYNRDERGIPLVFLERSIQDTGCGPRKMDGNRLDVTDGHRILWLNFAVDVLFWAAALWFLTSFKTEGRKKK
jgi:hypothetical protein